MKQKKYEEMTKKELLKIAKLHGIKGRHRMSKEKLIDAILKKKKPIKEMKKFEELLKKENLPKRYGENHLELLPKEPGTVYVHWEIEKKDKNPILKLLNGRKPVVTIPVMSDSGSGYMHVEEGKKLKAVIGIESGKGFKKIVQSEEITVPVSKPSSDKTVKWVKIDVEKGKVKRYKAKSETNKKLEEKKKKTEKTAKTVKYLRFHRRNEE